MRGDVKLRELRGVRRASERLGEQIRAVVFRRAMHDRDVLGFDAFADEVMTNVDVLRAGVELRVVCECDGGLIVRVECGGAGRRESEVRE